MENKIQAVTNLYIANHDRPVQIDMSCQDTDGVCLIQISEPYTGEIHFDLRVVNALELMLFAQELHKFGEEVMSMMGADRGEDYNYHIPPRDPQSKVDALMKGTVGIPEWDPCDPSNW